MCHQVQLFTSLLSVHNKWRCTGDSRLNVQQRSHVFFYKWHLVTDDLLRWAMHRVLVMHSTELRRSTPVQVNSHIAETWAYQRNLQMDLCPRRIPWKRLQGYGMWSRRQSDRNGLLVQKKKQPKKHLITRLGKRNGTDRSPFESFPYLLLLLPLPLLKGLLYRTGHKYSSCFLWQMKKKIRFSVKGFMIISIFWPFNSSWPYIILMFVICWELLATTKVQSHILGLN